ncbi:unnamed protein product [Vitrella brassicaformis CCMP3155]|uniref:Uncharacterized protein n=1 Tax=Vitrella brassicaformis (strain CCMP3155) TaxID=1169540 RepID=A0A0G4FDD8_VITBC|nr:unnamed protein product [Vitrella brassicaformis CCMP3155]|eukprot:CEM11213.1 unnamed protein product [Vitrella brassicaformis CCMP3155]
MSKFVLKQGDAPRQRKGGFTAAEQAAALWRQELEAKEKLKEKASSQRPIDDGKRRRKKRKKAKRRDDDDGSDPDRRSRKKRHRSLSPSSSSSSSGESPKRRRRDKASPPTQDGGGGKEGGQKDQPQIEKWAESIQQRSLPANPLARMYQATTMSLVQQQQHMKKQEQHAEKSPPRKERASRRSLSRSRSPSPSPLPRDPVNPLDAAYDRKAYRRLKRERKRRGSRSPSGGRRDPYWEHDRYVERSESPERERTEGPMWDTRKGSWVSKAGGVYIPPADGREGEGGDDQEPARYIRRAHRPRGRSRSPSPRQRDSPVYSPYQKPMEEPKSPD